MAVLSSGFLSINDDVYSNNYSGDYAVIVDNALLNRIAHKFKENTEYKEAYPAGRNGILITESEKSEDYIHIQTLVKNNYDDTFRLYLHVRIISENTHSAFSLFNDRIERILSVLLPVNEESSIESGSNAIYSNIINGFPKKLNLFDFERLVTLYPLIHFPFNKDGNEELSFEMRILNIDITNQMSERTYLDLIYEADDNLTNFYDEFSIVDLFSNLDTNNNKFKETLYTRNSLYLPTAIVGEIKEVNSAKSPEFITEYLISDERGDTLYISNYPDRGFHNVGEVVYFLGTHYMYDDEGNLWLMSNRSEMME